MKRQRHIENEDDKFDYNKMKVKDLRELVSTRGLDLKGLTRKEQLMDVLEEDDRKQSTGESSSSMLLYIKNILTVTRRLDNGEQE